jgi:hypothetical protein
MQVYRTHFFIFSLLLFSVRLTGQDFSTWKEQVSSLFEEEESIQWIKSYRGFVGSFHPVTAAIGFDGIEYHGFYQLNSSQLTFQLSGSMETGQLILQEIDGQGNTTGYITGDLNPQEFSGQWWNTRFDRNKSLSLTATDIIRIKAFNPGFQVYHAHLDSKDVELILQKESPDQISGFCYFQNLQKVFTVSGVCENLSCESMDLELWERETLFAKINLNHITRNRYQMRMMPFSGNTLIKECQLHTSAPLININYCNYFGSIDFIYPETDHPGFNQWLKGYIKKWEDAARLHLNKKNTVQGIYHPSERDSEVATGWIDISYFSPSIISGMITLLDPVTKNYSRKTFSYDLAQDREFEINDLFRKGFDMHIYKQKVIKKAVQDLLVKNDEPYNAWLLKDDFKYMTIRKDGFCCYTGFNRIHGQNYVLIPFDEVHDHLRRKPLVTQLLR